MSKLADAVLKLRQSVSAAAIDANEVKRTLQTQKAISNRTYRDRDRLPATPEPTPLDQVIPDPIPECCCADDGPFGRMPVATCPLHCHELEDEVNR